MKIVVVASQKGGSGKTTLAAHLAVEAERAGDGPTWLVDTDRQGTLSMWHDRREAETPGRLDVPLSRLPAGIEALRRQGASLVIIDTAPSVNDQTGAVLALSDLVLIPVRPSPADLWAAGETVAAAQAAGRPFLFAISQAKPAASITAQAVAALSEHGRVAGHFIADRVAYASAIAGGRTAPEITPKGPAAAEIAGLWQDVKSCFHENMKGRRAQQHG